MCKRRFIPSNGTDGEIFMSEFCYHCKNERWIHYQNENKEENKCQILSNSMIHDRPCKDEDLERDGWEWFDNGNFEDYPKHYKWWCEQYVSWDWDKFDDDGNNNPPEPPPYDPNQLTMPFMSEEVENILLSQDVLDEAKS